MPDDIDESRQDLVPDHEPGEETLAGLSPADETAVPNRTVAPDEAGQNPADWKRPGSDPGDGVDPTAARPMRWGWIAGGLALLLILGGVGYGLKLGLEAAGRELARINAWEEFSRVWEPPAGEPTGEALFPPTLGPFERTAIDEEAEFPALGIDLFGGHASYADGAGRAVDFHVYRATAEERAAVLLEVRDRLTGEQPNEEDRPRFTRRAFRETGRTAQFAVSPPDLYGNFWSAAGFFVFVRSGELSNREIDDVLHAFLVDLAPNGDDLPPVTVPSE